MDNLAIKLTGVSKKYCRSFKHTILYGVADLARSFAGLNQQTEKLRDEEFWALRDISFEVKHGETIGIIGSNGSGKSTLLKLLNGIFMPDTGSINVDGKVGALIEVGAGFHPVLTGRENIYVNAAILGMSKKEIERKFDDIVDFAGVGDFIDSPVKHYSSGMYVRLGFAIAAHCEPDILLIDEVLAVGDFSFQSKCFERLKNLKSRKKTVILVSNEVGIVKNFCDSALWIEDGRLYSLGDPKHVVDLYLDASREKVGKNLVQRKGKYSSTKEVEIVSLTIVGEDNTKKDTFMTGERLRITLEYLARTRVARPLFGLSFTRNDNVLAFATSSENDGSSPEDIFGKGTLEVIFDDFPLVSGTYILTVSVSDTESIQPYAQASEVIKMQTQDKTWGISRLKPMYNFQKN